MRRIFLSIICLFLVFVVNAQNNNWQNVLGGSINAFAYERGVREDTALCCPQQAWLADPNFSSSFITFLYPGFIAPFQNLIPSVDPNGGGNSIALGRMASGQFQASPSVRLIDTIKVDSFQYYLKFSVAALRKTWQGMPSDHAYPSFTVMDLLGNVLPISNTLYFNGSNAYNWQKANYDTTLEYLPWSEQVINLSAYLGQTILIQYAIKNYSLSNPGNPSIGLFDLRSASAILALESYCGGTNLQLSAPHGAFDSIVWKNNIGQILGRGDSIILTGLSGINVGDSIEMVLYPVVGQGVVVHHWHTLKMAPNVFGTLDFNVAQPCNGLGTQFTAINNSSCAYVNYSWDFGDSGSGASNYANTNSAIHPYSNTGNYTVKLITSNAIGCVDSLTKPIQIFAATNISLGPDLLACPLQAVTIGTGIPANLTHQFDIRFTTHNTSTSIQGWPYAANSFQVLFVAADTISAEIIDTLHHCYYYDTVLAAIQPVCVNHPPIVNDDIRYVPMNLASPQNLYAIANDSDNDGALPPQGNLTTSTLNIIQNAKHGIASTSYDIHYMPTNGYIGLDTFTYSITDNGSPNFSDTAMVVMHVVPLLNTSTNNVSLTVCKGSIVQLNPPLISGGSGNYFYNWSVQYGGTLSCTNCPNPFIQLQSMSMNVLLYVIDTLSAQSVIVNYQIYYDSIASNLTTQTITYGDSILLSKNNFTSISSIASITWNPSLNCGTCDSGYLSLNNIEYVHFTVSNFAGCILQDSFLVNACSNDCVWPGDANHDGVVNNFDVLNIGLGYGWNGTPRPGGQNLNFIGQPETNWGLYTAPTIDAKHADCDGNGLINANDTLAINYYYGNTHPKQSSKSGIPLLIGFTTNTAFNGDHLRASIYVGTPSIPADSIYGVAFTFAFDTNVVISNKAFIQPVNTNWLATPNVDGLAMSFNQYNSIGELHYALVRTNHTIKSGNGPVAYADMDIQTGNIAGKGNQRKYYDFITHLKNVRIVDLQGNEKTYTLGSDTVQINYFTGISQLKANQVLSIAPNPANDILKVQSIFPLTNASWSLMDMKGATVVSGNRLTQQGASISTKELKNGVYLLQINAAEGVWQETVIVQH